MSDAFVVDASVVTARFIRELYTPNAIALFSQVRIEYFLYAPEFCRLECVNVLWKHVRFHSMPIERAEQAIIDLMALPLRAVPVPALYMRALQIGLTHQLAAYDSVYIAMAEHLGHPLITIDEKQANAAAKEGVILKPLTDFTPA